MVSPRSVQLRRAASWLLRLVAAAALALDSFVHADLAMRYDPNRHAAISQGDLFRVEAAVSALAALLVIVVGNRIVWAFAFVVAVSALGAVILYRYNDIGVLGPLPDMYEPAWYSEKLLGAYAEAIATVAAVAGFLLTFVRSPRAAPAARELVGS
jgi:hypothetical protein